MSMDTERPKDNRGVLFKNKRRRGDKDPTVTGNAMVGGKEYWVSGWTGESANGTWYTSLSFKEKQPYHAPKSGHPGAKARVPGEDDEQEDMPW